MYVHCCSSRMPSLLASPAQEGSAADGDEQVLTLLPREDFKFGLDPKMGTTTECRNYYCIGEDGSLIVLFISYTTLGWPNSIQISVLYYNSLHAINWLESENYSASKISLSPDGHSIQVAGLSLENDPAAGTAVLKYRSTKPDGLHMKLHIRASVDPFQFLDGIVLYGKHRNEGSVRNQFLGSAKVHGSVEVQEQKREFLGRATALHVLQTIKPHYAINRTWFCYFVSDDMQTELTVLDVESPKRYEHQHYRYGYVTDGHRMMGFSTDVSAVSGRFTKCPHSGYKIPMDFEFVMQGTTMDGVPYSASIVVDDVKLFGTVDILEKLPSIIRLIIKTFIAKPYLFQWFGTATLNMRVEDGPIRVVQGKLYHEHSITNP